MQKPTVWTEAQWKQQTAVHLCLGLKARRRNQLITDIDLHLRRYHAADGLMPELQRDAIYDVLLACRVWLDQKAGKKKSSRRPAVETLYKQAQWAYVWTTYTARRNDKLDRGVALPTKALDPHYAPEARFRDKQGPQGTALKGKPAVMSEYVRGGFVPYVGKFDPVPGWDDPNVSPDTLQQGIEAQIQAKGAPVLQYYRKEERLRHMLIFMPDAQGIMKIHRMNGDRLEPFSSQFAQGSRQKHAPYACDEYGNFYVTSFGAKRGEVQHSTMLHGRPVVSAGMMIVEGGTLKYIDNDSGHYKPSADQLKEALRCLRDEHDVELAGVGYMWKGPNNSFGKGDDAASFAK